MEKKSKWPAPPDAAAARPGSNRRHARPGGAPKVSSPATDKDAVPEPASRGFLEPELGDPGSRADNDIERG
jgi:hypothetical protein